MTNSEYEPGDIVAGYSLVAQVSTYGPSETWKAYSEHASKSVILHFVPMIGPIAEEEQNRLMREASICNRLDHPGLVRFLVQGVKDDIQWFATELAEGMNLRQYVEKRRPVTLDDAISIMSQALDVVAYLHGQRVVHRSLRPESFLVKEDPGTLKVQLADLGSAKCFRMAELQGTITRLGERGYPIHAFTAPEALENPQVFDRRSDIYALGAILYFLLSGRDPYCVEEGIPDAVTMGGTLSYGASEQFAKEAVLIDKIVEEEPPPLNTLKPGLHQALVKVVERAMARDIDARYGKVQEMSQALRLAKASPSGGVVSEALTHSGHALVVGVGDDLPNTVDDAIGLANILKDPERCAYPSDQVHLLVGPDANRDAVLSTLDALAQSTDSQSTVVVYFSGHGYQVTSSEGASHYLMPHGYDVGRLGETAISGRIFTEKLQSIPSQKLVVLLDCCHAGGMHRIKAPGLQLKKSPVPPEARDLLASGKGRVLIASSREDELSFAGKPYSVFTLALIEALCGVEVARKDGYVRVGDLAMYTGKVVAGRTGGRQNPILDFKKADNFVVAYYAGGDSQSKRLPFDSRPEIGPGPGVGTVLDQSVLENVDPVKLLEAMQSAFDADDFEILSFKLGFDTANLAGRVLRVKMRSLIQKHQQQDIYAKLVQKVLDERPHLRNRLLE
jgi:serine/threonine protein kinase